jgi:exodeoxyribonuclease VII large subunit
MKTRLAASTLSLLAAQRNELAASAVRLRFLSPLRRIQTDRQRLDEFARRELSALQHRLALDGSRLKGIERRLEALNPLAVLGRGYALVTRQADGKLVSQVSQAKAGEEIRIRVHDGDFGATVSNQKE